MKIQKYDFHTIGSIVLRAAIGLTITTEILGLGMLSYLGTFTRYLADDYCEMVIVRSGPILSAVFQNYMSGRIRAANRFSHLVLVGLSELLGTYNAQLLPTLMIILWLFGLTWSIHEARKLIGIQQSAVVDFFLATSLVFFSAVQAPNRFQTFFWRSSVTTHFAPVVFMFLLSGYMLFQIRFAKGSIPAFWVLLNVFIASVVIGGISEPPCVLMIVISILLLLYVWHSHSSEKRPALFLIISSLAGTFLALGAMFFAPGNLAHGKTAFSLLPISIAESLKFAFEFIWDTLRTLPIPTLISIIVPGLLFFCMYIKADTEALTTVQKQRIGIILILLPLLDYLLIAVTFAPSAYGQSYPEERARFLGRFLMTAVLIIEGALLGVWVAQIKPFLSYRQLFFPIPAFFLLIFALYPLRTDLSLAGDVEAYKSWAAAWDARDEYIRHAVALGATDLVVVQLDTVAGIQEYKGKESFWVNRCAAGYYGLHSLRAP